VKQVVLSGFIILLSTGVGYGSFLITSGILQHIRIPRISSFLSTGKLIPSNVALWDFLAIKYGIAYNTSRWVLPLLAGLLSGLLILLIGFGIWLVFRHKRSFQFYTPETSIAAVFLLAGMLLSPSIALGGGFTQWDCNMNVIQSYEQTGQFLASNIPANDLVYWDGGNAVGLLLYAPNLRIIPQQLDGQWNYFLSGDSNALARLGLWNDDLAKFWRDKANVIITQQVNYSKWQLYLQDSKFVEVDPPQIPVNCESNTYLRIFIRE
jgi:hypothetical protein